MALALSAPAPSVPAASFTPALSDIKSSAQNVAGDLELMQDRLTRKFVNTVMDLGLQGVQERSVGAMQHLSQGWDLQWGIRWKQLH